MSRRLDRHRPLWEMYLIEGLEDGRFAILSKSHQILVDGVATIDLGQVILDVDPEPRDSVARRLAPAADAQRRPRLVRGAVRDSVRDPRAGAGHLGGNAGERGAHRRRGRRPDRRRRRRRSPTGGPSPETPLNTAAVRAAPLRDRADRRSRTTGAVRRFHGGTVNDVILATVTGALRAWLMTRAESVHASRGAARDGADERHRQRPRADLAGQPGGRAPAQPADRRGRARWCGCTRCPTRSRRTRRPVGRSPRTGSPGSRGFAPTTFHALGARVAAAESRRGFHLVVTNVPGPQFPLYAAGAQMIGVLPGPAAAARARAVDRGHLVRRRRLLRPQRRPGRAAGPRRARPVRHARRSRSSSTAPRRAGSGRRAAAAARPALDHRAVRPVTVRVYVRCTVRRLRGVLAAGGIGPAPFVGARRDRAGARRACPTRTRRSGSTSPRPPPRSPPSRCSEADEPARRVVLAVDVPDGRGGTGPRTRQLVQVDEVTPLHRSRPCSRTPPTRSPRSPRPGRRLARRRGDADAAARAVPRPRARLVGGPGDRRAPRGSRTADEQAPEAPGTWARAATV